MSEYQIFRLLDAAANRACEAVRVVEDVVRFIFNDHILTKEWKVFRHNLATVLQGLPAEMRFAFRHTESDVGASVTLASEVKRSDIADLIAANVTRLQQSLRSLEEAIKLVDGELSQRFEKIRYQSYSLAAATQSIEESIKKLESVRLCVLINGGASEQDYSKLIDLLLAVDVEAIQLRDKELDDEKLVDRARLLVAKTSGRPTLSIINDRADIAFLSRADGVHVGQSDLSVKDARQILGPRRLIGVSTHNAEQLTKAVLDGANYAGIGPIFESETKSFSNHGGLPLVEQVASQTALPLFAIGGISQFNVDSVVQAGVSRVAVASAVTQAVDPREAVLALKERLHRGISPEINVRP